MFTVRWLACLAFLLSMTSKFRLAHAQSEFASGERFVEETVVSGIPISTAIAFAPDSRIFVALKEGVVRVVQDGVLLSTPFIDIRAIVNKATDRGLLGIAIDPHFPQKPYVYLSYVFDPPGATPDTKEPRLIRIVRYAADGSRNYNVAFLDSEEVVLGKNSRLEYMAAPVPVGDVNDPERASCMSGLTMAGDPIPDCIPCDALSHTAGTLIFGADGYLYASIGDGADYDRPSTVAFNSQNLDAMSGRVVRVDPDTGDGVPGNPFFDSARPGSNRSRVWSYGYRNPFRITINPANGQVYAGDVGTSYYEEINAGKGANFGWPCYEGGFTDSSQQEGVATLSQKQVGFRRDPATVDFCNAMYIAGPSKVKAPLFTYRHPYDETGKDLGSSVTGVAFYSGTTYPERYRGALFFADYARLFIRYLTFDANGVPTAHDFAKEAESNFGAVQLIIGPDTNLYAVYLDLKTRTGTVRRFRPITDTNNPPTVKGSADPLIGTAPLVVAFSSAGSNDPDGQSLNYLWEFGDGESSAEANPSHVYGQVGTYTASLTVREATAPFALSKKEITIRVGVAPPVAFIDSPTTGLRYEVGKVVSFSGHTTPSSGVTMSWALLQMHNEHEHLVAEYSGSGGAFLPEDHCDDCSYELCLSAQGEEGMIDQKCVAVLPKTAPHTFASKPPGAPITYIDESREVLAPYVARPVVGSRQRISAATIANGRSFLRWSDGLTNSDREFLTQEQPRTFTALYVNKRPKVVVRLVRSSSRNARRVRLDASGSRDPEGEALRYLWHFSDGRLMSGPVITRTFKRRGTYGLKLTVTDIIGGAVVYRGSIRVANKASIRQARP